MRRGIGKLGLVLAVLATVVIAFWRVAGSGLPGGASIGILAIDGVLEVPVSGHPSRMRAPDGDHDLHFGSESVVSLGDPGGLELPLAQETAMWDGTVDIGSSPLVYLGDVDGRSVFLHESGSVGWLDRLRDTMSGVPSAHQICLTVGSFRLDAGGVSFCTNSMPFARTGRFDSVEERREMGFWASWVGVPVDTSAVTLSVGSGSLVWQSPVSRSTFFVLPVPPTDPVTLTALNSQGDVLSTEQLNVVTDG